MPVATPTANGLMSATDKKYGINYLYIQGGTLIKLCKSNGEWERSGGLLFASTGSSVGLYLFTIQQTNISCQSVVKSIVKDSRFKFYLKDNALYMYFNTNNGSWMNFFGVSDTSFTKLGLIKPDETYTEIPIE